jgi:hypothetical protein
MAYDAVNIPDPQTPVGAKGIAEASLESGTRKDRGPTANV